MRDGAFEKPPECVTVNGVVYPIVFDFRMGIAIEQEVVGSKEPDIAELLLRFYQGRLPEDLNGAVDEMIAFFTGPPSNEAGGGGKSRDRVYDYEQDADVLLASFFSVYGIDLTTAQIHWWTFKRLLLNMPQESPFMQRIGYRTADLKQMPKDLRKHYKKMKALFAIRDKCNSCQKATQTAEEREANLLAWIEKRYQDAQGKAV